MYLLIFIKYINFKYFIFEVSGGNAWRGVGSGVMMRNGNQECKGRVAFWRGTWGAGRGDVLMFSGKNAWSGGRRGGGHGEWGSGV